MIVNRNKMCQGNAVSMSALESASAGSSRQTRVFVLGKTKTIPIRIDNQTAWEAVRNDFIENKDKIFSNDYE